MSKCIEEAPDSDLEEKSYSIANCLGGIISRMSWGMEKWVVVCSISFLVTSSQWPLSTCPLNSFKVMAARISSFVTKSGYCTRNSPWCSGLCAGDSLFCSAGCNGNSPWCSGYCTNSSFCWGDCTRNSSLCSLLLRFLTYVLWTGGFGKDICPC